MPVSVLGIAGSPRRDGNTDALLREVLRGAVEAGAAVEFLAARDLKMRPCTECNRCAGAQVSHLHLAHSRHVRNEDVTPAHSRHVRNKDVTPRCAVQDDAQAVHAKLLAADNLVFATPIFFAGVPAQAKILIDRCQCFWALKVSHLYFAHGRYVPNKDATPKPLFDPPRPQRRGLWLACCGFDKRWMFDGPRRTMKALFNVLEFAWAGELCYKHVDAQGDILNHPTALADAYQAGLALASNTGSHL